QCQPAESSALDLQIADERSDHLHSGEVDVYRYEPDVPIELRFEQRAADVVEQAELWRPEPAVARQAAFGKKALRHAVAGDQTHVLLEHRVIQGLPESASDEIRPE